MERGSSQNVADIKNLYVYAFLDARRNFTGEPFLKAFEQQLQQRLGGKNIAVEWLWYEDSRVGRALSLEEVKKEQGGSQVIIPVPLVVMSNALAERDAHSSHRLIVFPKMIGLTGIRQAQKQYYATISWSIVDTANNEEVFKGSSSLVSKPGWEGSEEIHEDVSKLIDDFMNALYPSNASR